MAWRPRRETALEKAQAIQSESFEITPMVKHTLESNGSVYKFPLTNVGNLRGLLVSCNVNVSENFKNKTKNPPYIMMTKLNNDKRRCIEAERRLSSANCAQKLYEEKLRTGKHKKLVPGTTRIFEKRCIPLSERFEMDWQAGLTPAERKAYFGHEYYEDKILVEVQPYLYDFSVHLSKRGLIDSVNARDECLRRRVFRAHKKLKMKQPLLVTAEADLEEKIELIEEVKEHLMSERLVKRRLKFVAKIRNKIQESESKIVEDPAWDLPSVTGINPKMGSPLTPQQKREREVTRKLASMRFERNIRDEYNRRYSGEKKHLGEIVSKANYNLKPHITLADKQNIQAAGQHARRVYDSKINTEAALESYRISLKESGLKDHAIKFLVKKRRKEEFQASFQKAKEDTLRNDLKKKKKDKHYQKFKSKRRDEERNKSREFEEPSQYDIDHFIARKKKEKPIDLTAESYVSKYTHFQVKSFDLSRHISEFTDSVTQSFKSVPSIEKVVIPTIAYLYTMSRQTEYGCFFSITCLYAQALGLTMEKIRETFKKFDYLKGSFHDVETELVGGVKAESMSDTLDNMRSLAYRSLGGPVIDVVRELILNFVSIKLFSKGVADNFIKWLGKPAKKSLLDLTFEIIDKIISLVKYGELLMSGTPYSDLLFATHPTEAAMKRITDLMYYADKTYLGLPVPGKMCIREWLFKATESLAICEKILASNTKRELKVKDLRDAVYKLKAALILSQNMYNKTQRFTPMAVLLVGDPGIGKSEMINAFNTVHSRTKGREYHEGMCYHKIMGSPFWEAIRPPEQPYGHMSEVGNKKKDLAAMQGDESFSEILSLVDSVSMSLHMPDIKDKGTTFAMFELIIMDTNNESMNADVLFEDKAAVDRRIIFIRMVVKDEYRLENGVGIDPIKAMSSPDFWDRWWFQIVRKKPVGKGETKEEFPLEHGNFQQCIDVFEKLCIAHISGQEKLREMVKINPVPLTTEGKALAKIKQLEEALKKEEEKVSLSEQLGENKSQIASFIGGLIGVGAEADLITDISEMKERDVTGADEAMEELRSMVQREIALLKQQQIVEDKKKVREKLVEDVPKWGLDWIPHYAKVCAWCILLFFISSVLPLMSPDFFLLGYVITFAMVSTLVLRIFGFVYVMFYFLIFAYIGLYVPSVPDALHLFFFDRKERSKASLAMVIGYKHFYKPFVSKFWRMHGWKIKAALTVLFSGFLIQKVTSSAKKSKPMQVVAQTMTDFRTMSNVNKVINQFEMDFECCDSQVRIPINGQNLWNVMDVVVSESVFKGKAKDLYIVARSNIRRISIPGRGNSFCLGILENICLVNTHLLGNDEVFEVHISRSAKDSDITMIPCQVTNRVRVDLGDDMSLIMVQGGNFRNILKHFSKIEDFVSTPFESYFRSTTTSSTVLRHNIKLNVTGGESSLASKAWMTKYPDHAIGMCGLPIFIQKSVGACIGGIHFAGEKEYSFASVVTQDMLQPGIDELHRTSPYLQLASEGNMDTRHFRLPSVKSCVRYISMGAATYYGRLDRDVNINNRSSLRKTKIFELVPKIFSEHGFEQTVFFEKPLMQPITCNGEYNSPYNNGVTKIVKQKKFLDLEIMSQTINVIAEHFLKEIGDEKLSPLTVEVAINGAKHDAYLKRMNAATSAGFGFPGGKDKYIPIVEDEIREPIEKVKEILAEYMENAKQGNTNNPIYGVCLKDEPRSQEKVKAGSTRLFCASQVTKQIYDRMFLGPIYTKLVEKGHILGSKIGIDMHRQSDAFMKEMFEFDDEAMEGDYEKYDSGMPIDVGMAAASILYIIAKRLGYNEEALKQLRSILTDNMFPIIEILGDILRIAGYQPSGKYGTAEDNTLKGLILLVYYWLSHPILKGFDFFSYVRPGIYGDDLLNSIRKAMKQYMNNNLYKKFCEEVYGMGFTPASKSGVMTDFVKMDKCSFLKRNFAYHKDFNMITGRLDINSVMRALMWNMPSNSVSEIFQMQSCLESVSYEIALHVDSSEHKKMMDKIVYAISQEYKLDNDLVYPSFEKIVLNITQEPILVTAQVCNTPGSCDEDTKGRGNPLVGQAPKRPIQILLDPPYTSAERVDKRRANQMQVYNLKRKCQDELVELNHYVANSRFANYPTRVLQRDIICTTQFQYAQDISEELKIRAQIQDLKETIRVIDDRILLVFGAESEMDLKEGSITTLVQDENFAEATGASITHTSAGQFDDMKYGETNVLKLDNYLSRPVEIYKAQLALSTDVNINLAIWDLWSKIPSVRAKLRNMAYLKGDLHVRISYSGMPMHYGCFLHSYQPYAPHNETLDYLGAAVTLSSSNFRPFLLNYLSQAEGSVTTMVNMNKPIEMKCPFISTKPMHRLFNTSSAVLAAATSYSDLADAGNLYIYSVNQIKSVTTTPSSVYLQVYAWMENAQLGTNTATQIAITTESNLESKTGPIERITTSMSIVARALTSFTPIAPYAKASETALKVISGLAHVLGWSRPVIDFQPQLIKTEPYSNGANVIGFDYSKRLTLDPKQELTVSPNCVGINQDDMTYKHLCSRKSYFTTFTWADNAAATTVPIWSLAVSPNLVTNTTYGGTVYCQPTTLAYVAQIHEFWHGSITYTFQFVTSNFHRGKVTFGWEPNVNQSVLINADISLNKQFLFTVDIQETQEVNVVVNYGYARPWCAVGNASQAATISDTALVSITEGYSNGYIFVMPFTQLQSPDNSDISVNVYVSSEDMRFACLTHGNIPISRKTPALGLLDAPLELKAESEFNMVSEIPVTTVQLNKSIYQGDNLTLDYFGEELHSLRQPLRRFVTNTVHDIPIDATAAPKYLQFVLSNTHTNNNVFGNVINTTRDFFSYYTYAFMGKRGSIKYRLKLAMNYTLGAGMQVVVSMAQPGTSSSTGVSYSAYNSGASYASMTGTVKFMPTTNGGIEYEIPYYSNNLWLFSMDVNPTPGSSTGDQDPNFYRTHHVLFDCLNTASTSVGRLFIDIAAGEDFQFLRFMGSTPYSN